MWSLENRDLSREEREQAIRSLEDGALTVFVQQLGRGLRLHDGKACPTVLDFIGNAHANFRYDLRYRRSHPQPTGTLFVESTRAALDTPYIPT